MFPSTWRYLLDELVTIAALAAILLTMGLRLALLSSAPDDRSRVARRWGGVTGSLFALAFSAIGKHLPQGFGGEAFGFLLAAGFAFGFPFGVLLWYLLQGRLGTEGSSNNRWRGP